MRSAWWGHGLVVAGLFLSLGVTRVVWFEPREKERRSLESAERGLRAEIADLQDGIQRMDAWTRANPDAEGTARRAKRVEPAGSMVASLLESLSRIAAAHSVRTELIQPAGATVEEQLIDAAGATVTYQKAELRFRLEAPFRDVGAYVEDVEALEQLVVVRSVALRQEASLAPNVIADVSLWVYGSP
jgi:Tfp pilus assembly protein PilO